MTAITLSDDHRTHLEGLLEMSRLAGQRSDYVQGGGGNTSVKLDDRLMAIKASGFRLDQMRPDYAYAVLDYQAIRAFFAQHRPDDFADVEASGSSYVRQTVQTVDGLPQLRPSVEAGFHAILDRYVLHTHAVYANLAACSVQGQKIAADALAEGPAGFVWIPYLDPGSRLTFAIARAMADAESQTGRRPQILLMQNHGLIITGDDAGQCVRLHEEVNQRLAAAFGTRAEAWPDVRVRSGCYGDENCFYSDTVWLRDRLASGNWKLPQLTEQALYPDQLVYLAGQLGVMDAAIENAIAADIPLSAAATILTADGSICYRCGQIEAETIEQTLTAVLFIQQQISQAGYTVQTMDEAGQAFIRGWESEAYRKTLTKEQ